MAENRELALVLKLVADQFTSELKKSGGALGEFNRFISDWKTQLSAGATALFAIAKSTANYGEELLKSSQKTGIAVEALSGLKHAANLADVSMDTLERGLKTLSQNAVEAASGTGEGAKVFRSLGLSATDASGRIKPLDQLFFEFQDRLRSVGNQAQFVDAGVKSFGKSFLDLVPLVKQGSAATKEAIEDARRLGLVMSQEEAEAANKFNDELKKLQASIRGLTNQVGKELLPAFTQLMSVMTDIASGGGGQLIKMEFQGMATIFTLLSHGIRETAAELQGFWNKLGKSDAVKKFYDDAIAQGRKALDAETDKKLRTIFGMQGGEKASSGGPVKLEATREFTPLPADAFKGTGDNMVENFKLRLEREREDFQLYLQGLISMGRELTEAFSGTGDGMVKLFEDRRAQSNMEKDELIANEAAWVAHFDEIGGDAEDLYTHKMNLLRAYLSKELELNQRQAANLLMAWQNHDSARAEEILAESPKSDMQKHTAELNASRQSILNLREVHGDFFEGWASGMRNYVKDTKSGFGFAADMARRTAQLMEQGFKNFFFDAMEGKIKGFKDVLKSLLDFAKQIISQIMAQMVMVGIAKSFAGSFGGGLGANAGGGTGGFGTVYGDFGGGAVPKFAFGGVGDFGAGSLAMLHGQEAVIPLRNGSVPVTMKTMGNGGGGDGGGVTFIVNNYSDAKVEQPKQSRGADGRQTISMMIRQEMKAAHADGSMDSTMQRYGSNTKPIGR